MGGRNFITRVYCLASPVSRLLRERSGESGYMPRDFSELKSGGTRPPPVPHRSTPVPTATKFGRADRRQNVNNVKVKPTKSEKVLLTINAKSFRHAGQHNHLLVSMAVSFSRRNVHNFFTTP